MAIAAPRTVKIGAPPYGVEALQVLPTRRPKQPIINISGCVTWANFATTIDLADLDRHPINSVGKNLIVKYLLREVFWNAVEYGHLSVEFAGSIHLGVKLTQATAVRCELKAAGGPWPWFAAIAQADFLSGRIHQGRQTRHCHLADIFFSRLAEGFDHDTLAVLDSYCGGSYRTVFSERSRAKLPYLMQQALDYRFSKNIDLATPAKPRPKRRPQG